jgi:hypothetical protein
VFTPMARAAKVASPALPARPKKRRLVKSISSDIVKSPAIGVALIPREHRQLLGAAPCCSVVEKSKRAASQNEIKRIEDDHAFF